MHEFMRQAQDLFVYSRQLRRDFHRNPELGFQEFRTAGIIARELTQLGLELHTGVAETGVVAMVEGDQPGPTTLVRFDMDALPVQEDTGAEYASSVPGVMHACGHDGHVAVGLTVARMLAERTRPLKGRIKLVFQPAEEGLGGAERMIEQGVMENPRVDYTLSLHLWNQQPAGWVGINPGPLMAGADLFSIQVIGRGGHGALPQETVDPVAASAQIISALQTIVSRNISPLDTAVVSVCSLRAGDAPNVIPMTVDMTGTIRSFREEVRDRVVERFEAIVRGTAAALGCEAVVKVNRLTPAVNNHAQLTYYVHETAAEVMPEAVIDPQCPTMVSEDMAFMMQKAPGCYILVGAADPDNLLEYGHHHPRFNIDESALPRAAALVTAAAFRFGEIEA